MLKRIFSVLTGKKCIRNKNVQNARLSKNMDANIKFFKKTFKNAQDLVVREFTIAQTQKAAVMFLESMESMEKIADTIIEPLMIWARPHFTPGKNQNPNLDFISKNLLHTEKTIEVSFIHEIMNHILMGNTILLVNGFSTSLPYQLKVGLHGECKNLPQRSPSEGPG